LASHVADVLLPAAQGLAGNDPATAAHMFDHAIPHLLRRGDTASALGALLDRRSIATDTEDGHTARLNLDLVTIYIGLGESANAAFCLSNVLCDENAMNWLPQSLKASIALFERHGMADAVQWCQAVSSQQLKEEDVQTLDGHVSKVLSMVVGGVAEQAASGNFDPLLKYAEDLVGNGIPDEVPGIFKVVLQKHKHIDAHALEKALNTRIEDVTVWEDQNAISVRLRLVMADLGMEKQDLRSAAESLKRALELDLTQGSLLGECLDCAGRIAAAVGETRNAIYFTEVARLRDTGDEDTDRSVDDKERAGKLVAQLEAELPLEEVEAARRDANRFDTDAPEVQAAMVELIERVVGAADSQ
jgi:hypothetical protein